MAWATTIRRVGKVCMMRYAITDRHGAGGDEAARRRALVRQAVRLGADGVEYLQVREKDLPFAEAAELAMELQAAAGPGTRVLLNAAWTTEVWPPGIGVHLPSGVGRHGRIAGPVSASCHSVAEAEVAREYAELLLFAPVFEKRVGGVRVCEGRGLAGLMEVCRAVAPLPVFAMGGVTWDHAAACIEAGAIGVAGIRLFL